MVVEAGIASLIVASIGPAVIGASGLIGGAKQRKFQELANAKHMAFSREQQELQQEFQLALQRENFRESERLQKKIVQLQFQSALAVHKANLAEDIKRAVWPLQLPVEDYLGQYQHFTVDKIPLQIIVPTSLSTNFPMFGDIIKQYYSGRSDSPVYFYDGGWKNGQTLTGGALVSELWEAFEGVPTLVLMPQLDAASFSLSVCYWGIGRDAPTSINRRARSLPPEPKRLITIMLSDLRRMALRMDADEVLALYHNNIPAELLDKPKYKNCKVRVAELKRAEVLRADEKRTESIAKLLNREFDDEYDSRAIDAEIVQFRTELLTAYLDIVCTGIADVYHLLEFGTIPLAPSLAKDLGLAHGQKAFCAKLAEMYAKAIESADSIDSLKKTVDYPSHNAAVAAAFANAGMNDLAGEFARKAIDELTTIYPANMERSCERVAVSQRGAVCLLLEHSLLDEDSDLVWITRTPSRTPTPRKPHIPQGDVTPGLLTVSEINERAAKFFKHGDVESALRCYQEIAGRHRLADYNIGVCLLELKRIDEAKDAFVRASNKGVADAPFQLAILSHKAGNDNQCERLMQRAAELGHQEAIQLLYRSRTGA